ncbi:hypothetical protein ACFWY6_35630 [Streptomyces sp. NPDC059037]|uniref:hypothetical protein n=1 Tax=Streptomyces sp. NPDC059037 TaxID=3346710 RepID=UPI0036CC0C9D
MIGSRVQAAIDLAAAELPALARHSAGSEKVAAALERLVGTPTACVVLATVA